MPICFCILTFVSSLPTECAGLQGRLLWCIYSSLLASRSPLPGHWWLLYTVSSCLVAFLWAHLLPRGPFLDEIIPREAWGCGRKQIAGGGRRLGFSPNFNKALVPDTASSYSLCHYTGRTLTFRFAFFQVLFRILLHFKAQWTSLELFPAKLP